MIKRGVIFIFAILFLVSYASASQEGYCATAEITSINPSSIGADEGFTVGIVIDNCGDKIPENVIFEIIRHSEDIEIKEPFLSEEVKKSSFLVIGGAGSIGQTVTKEIFLCINR